MTTAYDRGSAKIYQFPVKARTTTVGRRITPAPAPVSPPPRAYETVVGEAWYHEEAVQEAVDKATPRRNH